MTVWCGLAFADGTANRHKNVKQAVEKDALYPSRPSCACIMSTSQGTGEDVTQTCEVGYRPPVSSVQPGDARARSMVGVGRSGLRQLVS